MESAVLHTFLMEITDEVFRQVPKEISGPNSSLFSGFLNQPFQEVYMLKVIIYETDPQPEGRDPQVGPPPRLFCSSLNLLSFCCLQHPLSILVLDLRGFRTLASLS